MAAEAGSGSRGPALEPTFTREGILGGNRGRRAGTLLYLVENRSALLASRSRAAMARFETQRTVADREQAFLAALADGRTPPHHPHLQDIERFADGWADLVPDDSTLRGSLLHRIAAKYGLPREAQSIRRVLHADDAQVREAYA